MPLFQNHLGINITSSKMQLVEVTFDGEKFSLENVDEEYFEEYLKFDEKDIKFISILQNAFNEILLRKPIKSKYISFTLPHDFFRVMQIPYDQSLSNEELTEQFKWELSVLYPKVSADDVSIQYITVKDNNKKYSENAIVVAILKKISRILNDFCIENKLILRFIDNVHFASDSLIILDDSIAKDDGVLSLYISNKYISVMYSIDQNPVYFDTIPINHVSEIVPSLVQELRSSKISKLNLEIKKAYISGENISDSLLTKAEEILNIKFNRLNPFEKIKASPELFDKKVFTEKYDSFSSAAGIAYRIA